MEENIKKFLKKLKVYRIFGIIFLLFSIISSVFYYELAVFMDAMDGNYFYEDYVIMSRIMIFICSCSTVPNILAIINFIKFKIQYRHYKDSNNEIIKINKEKSKSIIITLVMSCVRLGILVLLAIVSVLALHAV